MSRKGGEKEERLHYASVLRDQLTILSLRTVFFFFFKVASDISLLLRLTSSSLSSEGKDPLIHGYKIKSIRAIDLFPQTHHAEGLCVLMRD